MVAQVTIKSLMKEEDIPRWAKFCASCFSYKSNPPPPSYFERHYYNDPRRDFRLILVAIDDASDEIVSSIRVFRRTVSRGPMGKISEEDKCCFLPVVEAGGIGEVCTHERYRRQGISKKLQTEALRVMKEDAGMEVSLLHASPDFAPVYEKIGYRSISSQWSDVDVNLANLMNAASSYYADSYSIRQAKFPRDTAELQFIHRKYSEQRLAGCIIRNEEYWNTYVSAELAGSIYVLERIENCENCLEEKNEKAPVICGWISLLRSRAAKYQIRDFGTRVDCLTAVFYLLLNKALCDLGKDMSSNCGPTYTIHLPTFLLEELKTSKSCNDATGAAVNFEAASRNDDTGWMWRTLNNGDNSLDMVEVCKDATHLIWPSDSF